MSCFKKGKLCADGTLCSHSIAGKSQVGLLPLANNVQHFFSGLSEAIKGFLVLETAHDVRLLRQQVTEETAPAPCVYSYT